MHSHYYLVSIMKNRDNPKIKDTLCHTVIQLRCLLWNWQPKLFAIGFVSVQFEPSNFD